MIKIHPPVQANMLLQQLALLQLERLTHPQKIELAKLQYAWWAMTLEALEKSSD